MPLPEQFTDERHGKAAGHSVFTAPSSNPPAKKYDVVTFAGKATRSFFVLATTSSRTWTPDWNWRRGDSRTWNFVRAVEDTRSLCEDWNGYRSEPPSELARELAKGVVLTAASVIVPDRVAPSAQGGIGICFYRGNKYADIECFNTGEILATVSDGSGRPQIWEVKPREIRGALEKIGQHINS
jgi:hypothetical protein